MKTTTFTLQNTHLSVNIDAKGAELTSIKSGGIEYMWQADPQFWARHAPILFPVIGRLVDQEYIYKGEHYSLSQHGFARHSDFHLVAHSEDSLTLELKASAETRKIYPFDFVLQLKYLLVENILTTEYKVINPSSKDDLYFSIGAHPAFNCPFETGQKRSDYQLIFDKKIAPPALLHINGLYEGDQCVAFNPAGTMPIVDTLFDKDSLTFSPNPFSKVTFVHQASQKAYLSVAFDNFPFLGIWSMNDKSPFVCIEPWYGIADRKDHNKDFTQKEGIEKLAPEGVFSCSFMIEVH